MSKDSGAAGAIITAFMLGTITGAAIALLVAPATGDDVNTGAAFTGCTLTENLRVRELTCGAAPGPLSVT